MRWIKFVETQISPSEEEGKIRITEIPRYINAETVDSLAPGMVPSDIARPGGEPVAKPATYICTGGEHILVGLTINEVLYKLTWEGIKIEGPEDVEENEYRVTEVVKRPAPEVGPGNESKIIQ